MLAVKDMGILKYVPDYRINLIAPNEISDGDFGKFHTVLGKAFQFIKYSKDSDKLEEIVEHDQSFKNLDRRTVELINETTNSNIEIPKGAKEVNLCIAIEGMKKKAADKAIVIAIKNLMDSMKLTAQQAMDALKISSDEQIKFLPLLQTHDK